MAPQREWFDKDYYKVLGVPDTATEKEITRAYRKLAKQYHPDAGSGDETRFKEISAAYDVLGDGAKRKEYDEVRRLGPVGAGGFRPFDEGGGGGFSFRVDDLGDLFGGLFNRGRTRGGGGRPRPPAPGGARTSRPSSTCRSSTPSTASPPRSTSPATRPARAVTGRGRSRARRR